jgi:uncharacterized cupredoxin-like copper-binding protein
MRHLPFLHLFCLLALCIAALTACGAKSTTLNVDMKDFSFSPDTFSVPAGAKVTLNLKDSGALEHEFVIMLREKGATLPFDEDDETNIYWEHELLPGESAKLEFTAPSAPGEYEVVCGTAGHLEQGMRATLTVK